MVIEGEKTWSDNKMLSTEIVNLRNSLSVLENKSKNYEELLEKNLFMETQLLSNDKAIGKFPKV